MSNIMRPDLQNSLPSHKSDLAAAESAVRLGWPTVEPVAMELLTWLQDINWPVAQVLASFLEGVGADLAPYVRQVLQAEDDVWKYYVIQAVVARSPSLSRALEVELHRIARYPTVSEHQEEVDLVAGDALELL
jgi:hypothetical protein